MAIHDLTLAAQYCNRIILLKDGVCYAQGSPEEVLTGKNVLKGYGAQVIILDHPMSGMPVVLPVPGQARVDGGDGSKLPSGERVAPSPMVWGSQEPNVT